MSLLEGRKAIASDTDGRTDGLTDGRTDIPSYRVTLVQLMIYFKANVGRYLSHLKKKQKDKAVQKSMAQEVIMLKICFAYCSTRHDIGAFEEAVVLGSDSLYKPRVKVGECRRIFEYTAEFWSSNSESECHFSYSGKNRILPNSEFRISNDFFFIKNCNKSVEL